MQYTLIPEEQKQFFKYARRFDDHPPERRYGIVNPSAEPPYDESKMLYSDCPRKLHNLHYDNWPSVLMRKHLDRLEIAEGKKPKGYSSLT
jgi:hypothetical protein